MSNALVITLQPPTEFYKDEGGKSNFMTLIVTTPPAYIITGTVKLKATLCYENYLLTNALRLAWAWQRWLCLDRRRRACAGAHMACRLRRL